MTKARDLGDFISDGTIAETVTADGLNLGDNEKIQLGASQDLQLFHDGTSSIISDQGSGPLLLRATDFQMTNAAGSQYIMQGVDGGAVTLYHAGSGKVTTSATGATVTGTIAVSDSFNATSGTFTVQSNGTDILNVTSTEMTPQTDGAISLGSASNGFNNMYLDGSAYVSGNVGIGTSSPSTKVEISGTGFQTLSVTSTNSSPVLKLNSAASSVAYLQWNNAGSSPLSFYDLTASTERMRIDSSGDVNIVNELKAGSYNETYAALSGTTPTVDCEAGNFFSLTTSGNTTFTFSNPPSSGTAFGFTLQLTAGGTHTITWPSSVDWAGGSAPDAPASGETNVLVFITYDGGTTWYGFQAGAALA